MKDTKILNHRVRKFDGKQYQIAYRPGLMFGESTKEHAKLDARGYRKIGNLARIAKETHGWAVYLRRK